MQSIAMDEITFASFVLLIQKQVQLYRRGVMLEWILKNMVGGFGLD